eukprot:TRINITY_DN3190_c2_g1_i3.p1 TRINITY_DN3190_c2_g1~~TRINITY_DN3190_c2_g1_i3.p1  ORF type:complete len:144 (+),score=14.32 TRINITY_DN3190_c2_g1_i3:206-637(+)
MVVTVRAAFSSQTTWLNQPGCTQAGCWSCMALRKHKLDWKPGSYTSCNTGYSSVVLGGALVPSFRERVVATLGRVPRPLPYFFRWCVAFGITYHWAAGIRHLLWDYGFFGFNMQHVTRSSIGLYAGAFATAVAACTTKVTADK